MQSFAVGADALLGCGVVAVYGAGPDDLNGRTEKELRE